jgi:transcriptional regulator with XRE-family HTH domain
MEEVEVIGLEELGRLISRRRKELGLTLAEGADRMGVGRRLLIELEHGERAVAADTLIRVLNLLGYDLVIRSRGEGGCG